MPRQIPGKILKMKIRRAAAESKGNVTRRAFISLSNAQLQIGKYSTPVLKGSKNLVVTNANYRRIPVTRIIIR